MIRKIIALIIRLTIIAGIIMSFLSQNWMNVFVSVLALVLTFLPFLLTKQWNIELSPGMQLIIIIFIFLSSFLGEIVSFYERFWWWDDMLHSISGIVLGIIGFLLIYSLNRYQIKDVKFELSPFFIAFFAFCFAVGIGAIWEIFEFSMDTIFGMNMQKWRMTTQVSEGVGTTWQGAGLVDTMSDLIEGTVGALIICIIGYIKLKYDNKNEEKQNA